MSTITKSLDFIKAHLGKGDCRVNPLIIGVSGPQGSGKTYLSDKLTTHLKELYPELHVVGFSIDDFYLTYKAQCAVNEAELAKGEFMNPLLIGRGLPGTHDLPLLFTILNKISNKETNYKIPRYNKSLYSGKGDREAEGLWYEVGSTPIDIAICEGWFNGYTSISNEEVWKTWEKARLQNDYFKSLKIDSIIQINENLAGYRKIWDSFNLFIYLTTNDINNVYRWRLEQEHALIKEKNSGMTDLEVERFVNRYMPLYYLCYPNLKQYGLNKAKIDNLQLNIDLKRNIIDCYRL